MMLWRKRRGRRLAAAHTKFQERARTVRRRPWWLAGALLVVLLAVGGLVYLFAYSSAFVVEQVRVEQEGGPPIDDDLSATVEELAQIQHGVPLARVDTDAAEERILGDLRVEEVSVRRAWPDGISLVVTPRTPELTVIQPGGVTHLSDAEGIAFTEVDDPPSDLPRVRVASGDIDPAELTGALAVHHSLPEDLTDMVPHYVVTRGSSIQFTLSNLSVVWGTSSANADKAVVLQSLLEQEHIVVVDNNDNGDDTDEQAELTIDLSVPTLPVVTGLPEVEE